MGLFLFTAQIYFTGVIILKAQLEKIEALAKQELEACTEIKALDDLRVKYLGKKVSLLLF